MERNRDSIGMFDVLKGCLMLMIVFAHHYSFVNGGMRPQDPSAFLTRLTDWSAIAVGLFFVIAGYQFRPAKNLAEYIKKQFQSLMLPYIGAIFLSAAGRCATEFVSGGQVRIQTVSTIIAGGLYGAIQNVEILGIWAYGIQALWFLPVFFFSGLFFQLLHRISGKKASVFIWIITIAAVLFPDAYHIQLPWFFIQSCAVLGLMELGKYLRSNKVLYRKLPVWFVLISAALFIFCHLFSAANIASNIYRFGVLDYLTTVMMSTVVLRGYIRSGMENWKGTRLLEYIGMYSMLFFLVHGVGLLVIPWEAPLGEALMHMDVLTFLPFPAAAAAVYVFRCAGILLGCRGLELCMRLKYRKRERRQGEGKMKKLEKEAR